MGGVDRMTNCAGSLMGALGKAKIQTASDATAVAGAEIDRHTYPGESCFVVAFVGFTSSSGASGGKNTLLLELYHDTVTGMGSEAQLDSDSYIYTWVANGANDGFHILPVDLSEANRFIRAKATLTKAGTITIASQQVAVGIVMGGAQRLPYSGAAAAGYESTTEPS